MYRHQTTSNLDHSLIQSYVTVNPASMPEAPASFLGDAGFTVTYDCIVHFKLQAYSTSGLTPLFQNLS